MRMGLNIMLSGHKEVAKQAETLLIISHTPSPNTQLLNDAVIRGALGQIGVDLNIIHLSPFETTANDVLKARAVIFGTTENFGYMAGASKDFFDRCYYDLLGKTDGLPYAVYIRAGLDGTGTQKAIDGICGALKWKEVQTPLICQGKYQSSFEKDCERLGATMAAGLDAGIY